MNKRTNRPPTKANPVSFALILVGFGVLVILSRFVDFGGIRNLWPLFLLVPVIPTVASLFKDPKRNAGTMVPITILTFFCVYFLWLNFTGWHHVGRTWPNFILAPGLGFLAAYALNKEMGLLIPGVIITFIAGTMYSTLIFHVDRYLIFGTALIVLGIGILLGRKQSLKTRKEKDPYEM